MEFAIKFSEYTGNEKIYCDDLKRRKSYEDIVSLLKQKYNMHSDYYSKDILKVAFHSVKEMLNIWSDWYETGSNHKEIFGSADYPDGIIFQKNLSSKLEKLYTVKIKNLSELKSISRDFNCKINVVFSDNYFDGLDGYISLNIL